jgi:hypothetical protein
MSKDEGQGRGILLALPAPLDGSDCGRSIVRAAMPGTSNTHLPSRARVVPHL